MAMPQRPREHVVETESEKAFQAVLPSEWTVAWTREDYGIDGRVEIFERGFATGLSFGAQLKATDEPDLRKALKAKVDVTALNYMSAQADPVLLVRFHAPTGRVYARWLHRKDVVLKRAEQKTVTVAWSPSDLLDRSDAAGLAEEVRRFRRFRTAGLDGVLVGVVLDPPLTAHEAAVEMLLNTMSVSAAGGFLRFGGPGPYDADVRAGGKMLRVDMSVASTRIEFPAADASARQVAENVLVACAVCLARVGRPDVAAALVATAPDAPVLGSYQVTELAAAAFAGAGRWREASDLVRHGRDPDGDPTPLSVALRVLLLLHAHQIPVADRRHVSDNMLADAETELAAGRDTAGATFYSAGNFLFNVVHDYPAALAAYENAAAAREDYADQGYYLGELAAAQFETGAHDAALTTYDQAISADPDDPHLIARRADVLAHAGRYGDALDELDRYEHAAGDDGMLPVWELERDALRTVVARVGRAQQRTGPPQPGADPAAVLAADGLAPHAWIETAAEHASRDELDAALDALLVACAFPTREVPEPWPLALHVTFVAGLDDLFDRLVAVAWRRFGEDLVADVLAHNDALDPDSQPAFLTAFGTRIDELRGRAPGSVDVRFLNDDGTRDVVRIRRPPR
jgi:tetratricopeptide (TPR) repeat protein